MKVLIIAHEFSPYLGSECSVGWNLVNEIAKIHDVIVIHASTNQLGSNNYSNHVKDYFDKNPESANFKVISIPQPKRLIWLIKLNKFISGSNSSIGVPYIYFYIYKHWQKDVYKYVKFSNFIDNVDVIHQLTSISFREPGYLWKLSKPFFWGPISGNVKIPFGYFSLLTFRNRVFQAIRNLSIIIQLKYSRRIQLAAKKSSVLYCVTKEDYNYFSKINKENCVSLLDVGSVKYNLDTNIHSKIEEVVNFVWIGRIVYSKAIEILIHTVNNINHTNYKYKVHFKVIGNGPDYSKNRILAEKLNIDNISWIGEVSHYDTMELLKSSDCLIHTSIREATSAVVLEALSFGVPVICHDAFGMSIAVDNTCGVKIPLVNFESSVEYFTNVIIDIVNNPGILKKLRLGAVKRSDDLSWEEMARIISNNYNKIK
jgi:glycosyltransferase involved in cell wall biosynthesis